ncbi:hypothetical protein [Streptomyces sp. NPDC007083]|uniref:hypothetical protein n=1 Tax=Streptomyces sp. NPDC007083 TaxID=3156913 RepID=UPI0033E9D93B
MGEFDRNAGARGCPIGMRRGQAARQLPVGHQLLVETGQVVLHVMRLAQQERERPITFDGLADGRELEERVQTGRNDHIVFDRVGGAATAGDGQTSRGVAMTPG